MPWQEASAASEQHRFIRAWLRGEETVADLCRRFGLSRKTGYKRIARSRPRPRSHPSPATGASSGPLIRSATATMTSDHMRRSGNSRPRGWTARRTAPIPVGSGRPSTAGGVTVCEVRTNGQSRWQGSLIYLSETRRREPVGLVPHDDRYETIQYGPVQLGRLDAHTGQVLPTATKVLPICPVAQGVRSAAPNPWKQP